MPPKYKSRKRDAEAVDGSDEDVAVTTKRTKSDSIHTVNTDVQIDKEGCEYWEISNTRRIQLANFKGNYQIAIREYYEKDGQMLPGKKGINLPLNQFAALVEILPQLEKILKEKGQDVPRPKYNDSEMTDEPIIASKSEVAGEPKVEDDASDEDKSADTSSKLEKFKYAKKNHEATSDEED